MISICTSSVKDIPRLKTLAAKTFIESHGHSAPGADLRGYCERCFNPRVLEAELQDRRNLFFMLYVDENIAGYSKMTLNSPCAQAALPLVSRLERIYLLTAFHGRQLGEQLLQFNIDLSKKMGQQGIWLSVWKENEKAVQFYKRNGFSVVGESVFRVGENHVNADHVMFLAY